MKWSTRRTSKACVFFSFFILVARQGLAGSCGRLGGGGKRAAASVVPFWRRLEQLRRKETGADSQALIQWRIPSLRRHLPPHCSLSDCSWNTTRGERREFSFHTIWCDHHTSVLHTWGSASTITVKSETLWRNRLLCFTVFYISEHYIQFTQAYTLGTSSKHPSAMCYTFGHMAHLAPLAGVLKGFYKLISHKLPRGCSPWQLADQHKPQLHLWISVQLKAHMSCYRRFLPLSTVWNCKKSSCCESPA